jgi:hypothetical protein
VLLKVSLLRDELLHNYTQVNIYMYVVSMHAQLAQYVNLIYALLHVSLLGIHVHLLVFDKRY